MSKDKLPDYTKLEYNRGKPLLMIDLGIYLTGTDPKSILRGWDALLKQAHIAFDKSLERYKAHVERLEKDENDKGDT